MTRRTGCALSIAYCMASWALIIVGFLALVGCEQETGGSIMAPPERYQGNTSAAVHFSDRLEAERICTERVGRASTACANIGGPNIWIENPCHVADQHWYPALLCHELAHVNSWPADHGR
jgi:hypothetical protein